jgi:hypothetical protein
MTEREASRTLVKSQPELWAQCSDSACLARHLNGSFGEIRITRLEPETAVAWEGEHASGTVRLEPSGWGTRVILTARAAADRPAPGEHRDPPASGAHVDSEPPHNLERIGLLWRLRGALRPRSEEPALPAEAQAALVDALDSLGQAHHRPFSRP